MSPLRAAVSPTLKDTVTGQCQKSEKLLRWREMRDQPEAESPHHHLQNESREAKRPCFDPAVYWWQLLHGGTFLRVLRMEGSS